MDQARSSVSVLLEAMEATDPFLDLTSGYVLRSIAEFPKQGPHAPWRTNQNYLRDVRLFRYGELEEGMEFASIEALSPPTREA